MKRKADGQSGAQITHRREGGREGGRAREGEEGGSGDEWRGNLRRFVDDECEEHGCRQAHKPP